MINNNAVTLSASLNLGITIPAIGGSTGTSLAYTDGDKAQDVIVMVGTGPTALNTALGGAGFMLLSNPGPVDVDILVGTTALGVLPAPTLGQPPCGALFPISSSVIINATVASGTQNIGVSVVKTTANA